jgi:hypothetical protein
VLCPVNFCCDGGSHQAGEEIKLPEAAVVKSNGGEHLRKRFRETGSGMWRKTNESEQIDKASKCVRRCQNRNSHHFVGMSLEITCVLSEAVAGVETA